MDKFTGIINSVNVAQAKSVVGNAIQSCLRGHYHYRVRGRNLKDQFEELNAQRNQKLNKMIYYLGTKVDPEFEDLYDLINSYGAALSGITDLEKAKAVTEEYRQLVRSVFDSASKRIVDSQGDSK